MANKIAFINIETWYAPLNIRECKFKMGPDDRSLRSQTMRMAS